MKRTPDAERVWAHYIARWRENVGSGRAPIFTTRRQVAVHRRLVEFDRTTLIRAIDATFSDEFLLANGYVAPEHIFKSAETVEKRLSRLQAQNQPIRREKGAKRMSTVTSMILSFSVLEDEEARMEEVEAFSEDTTWTAVDTTHGKCMELPVFLLAANGWDLEGFGLHLRKNVRWEEPQSVRLYVCGQQEDAFREVCIPPLVIAPKDPRHAIAYMRTAAESQQNLDEQLSRIRRWADANRVKIGHLIEDSGTSGMLPAELRPGFRWAMNAMSWTNAGMFIVTSWDRLARDPDMLKAAIETVRRHGGEVVVVDEQEARIRRPAKGEK